MAANRSAKSVFVGNIPYDATEEQLTDIFKVVGPVVSFSNENIRLVFDRDSGKPQGYGFCEFMDAETALSAMRNLNNTEFSGRNLRVDFAEKEKAGQLQRQAAGGVDVKSQGPRPVASIPNMSNAPSTAETVNSFVEGLSQLQVHDLISKLKVMISQKPSEARQILLAHPPFAYAVVQALMTLGMINQDTIKKLVQVPANQPQVGQLPPMKPATGIPIPATNVPIGIPPPIHFNPNAMMQPNIPPPAMGFPAQPPVFPPQGVPQVGFPSMPMNPQGFPDQAVLLQLLSLPQEKIDQLPFEQRQAILQLKQIVGAGGMQPQMPMQPPRGY